MHGVYIHSAKKLTLFLINKFPAHNYIYIVRLTYIPKVTFEREENQSTRPVEQPIKAHAEEINYNKFHGMVLQALLILDLVAVSKQVL